MTDVAVGTGSIAGTQLIGSWTGNAAGPQVRYDGLSGFIDIGLNANGHFVVEGNDNARLVVERGGDVGIGVRDPGATLDIAGDIAVNRGARPNVTFNLQAAANDDIPFELFDESGSQLIQIASEAFYVLAVWGQAIKNSGGSSWGTFSDLRLKQDLRNYEHGLDEILRLHPVRFRYRADTARQFDATEDHTGFVAQDVAKIIPEAVSEGNDGYLVLNADPIHWASINAIKELHGLIEEKDAEILPA